MCVYVCVHYVHTHIGFLMTLEHLTPVSHVPVTLAPKDGAFNLNLMSNCPLQH